MLLFSSTKSSVIFCLRDLLPTDRRVFYISDYNSGLVCFSILYVFASCLNALLLGTNTVNIVTSSWRIDSFVIMITCPLYL